MVIEKYAILDTETGEVLPYKPKYKHRNKFTFAVYFPGNRDVRDFLIKNMSSSNIAEISKKQIVGMLRITNRAYTRQINRLIKENFCLRLRKNYYFINPSFFIKTSRSKFLRLQNFYNKTKIDLQEARLRKNQAVAKNNKGDNIIIQVKDILSGK